MNGTSNLYNGADQMQRVKAGTTIAIYTQLGLDNETTAAGTTYYIRCSCSALAGERTPTGTFYYLFDGLGSVVGLTDSTGNLVNSYQYDPYGNLTSSTGTVSNPWRYAGGYFDATQGCTSSASVTTIRAQDGGRSVIRWGEFGRDSEGQSVCVCGNNPVNEVDPSGKASFGCNLAVALNFFSIGLNIFHCFFFSSFMSSAEGQRTLVYQVLPALHLKIS